MANGRSRLKEVLKINRKTFFNPSGWFDYEGIKALNATIIDIIRSAFVLPKPDTTPPAERETFEEAMKRQGLTEKDVAENAKTYKNFAIGLALLGVINIFYALYLLFFYGAILGFILAAATTTLFFGQAFRFDFWSYQMSQRRLGVSLAEWKQHIMGKKGRLS